MKIFTLIMFYSLLACQNNAATKSDTHDNVDSTAETPVLHSDSALSAGEQLNSDGGTLEDAGQGKDSEQIIDEKSKEMSKTSSSKSIEITQKRAVSTISKSTVAKVEERSASNKTNSNNASEEKRRAQNTSSKVEESSQVDTEVAKNTAGADTSEIESTASDNKSLDHSDFHQLLQKHVSSSGTVDYAAFKKDEGKLDAYLSLLSNHVPTDEWSENNGLAFWMNAYNAATIKLILKNYPVKSIRDLHNGEPWDQSWVKLGDKTYSLNDIEHVIIRPTYNDARIHFAVNCAAKSCPPLWNQAFTESNVDDALTKLTKQFVNSSANQVSKNSLTLSKIFEWYSEDFGDITDFISKYSSDKVSPDAAVSYSDYDWTLNGK